MSQQANAENDVLYLLGFSPCIGETDQKAMCEALPVVETLTHGDLLVWYVSVERQLFEGNDAEANLGNAEWLMPRVLAHQAAVEHLSNHLNFLPATFGILFSEVTVLENLVDENRESIQTFLSNDAQCQEWGIKIVVSWKAAVEQFNKSEESENQETRETGLNYLRRKKMMRQRDAQVRDWISTSCSEIEQELQQIATKIYGRQILASDKRSTDTECIANLALLIPPDSVGQLHTWHQEWSQLHTELAKFVEVQLTGPWPLYSFTPNLTGAASSLHAA